MPDETRGSGQIVRILVPMYMVAAGGAVTKPHKPGYFRYGTILSLPGFYVLRVTEVGAMLSAKSAEYYCRAGECIAEPHLTNDVLTKWWCITWADHWRRLAQNVEPDAQAQTEERRHGRGFGDYAGAFNPDEIRMMRNALNDALKATQVNRARYAMGGNAEPARAALAKHIIEAAKQGERDPRRLSDIASGGLAKAHKG